MKKIFYISGIVSITLIVIITWILFNNSANNVEFNEKMKLLNEKIVANESIKELEKKQEQHIVVLAICDNKTRAVVKKAQSNSMDKAYRKVKEQTIKYINKNNYLVELMKIDFAKDIKEISMDEFEKNLSNLKQEYTFRNGIILEYQNRDSVILTEAELNSNNIIDYDECEINIMNLNKYLIKSGEETVNTLPISLKQFDTISYFCDDNNKIFEIDNITGKRTIRQLNPDIVSEMLHNATNYLFNMVEDDGKFIYGYSPLQDKENSSYNILRHAGTTWSMIKQYNSTLEQKQVICDTINYMTDTVKYLDSNTAYVEELKNGELKL